MNKPKISIITVCYNSIAHIEETILSIICQSYDNKEYLVIDGGSTDGTFSIIEKYKNQISYFVSEPDKGISDAFNKGIVAATGDIIGIINSDDKLEKNALQIVADNFSEDVDMYRGKCMIWNDKTNFIFEEIPTINWSLIPIKMRGAHPATFVSKEAYNKLGLFDVSLKYAMDTDLFIRFSQKKAIIKYIDAPLAYFRLGGVSQENEKKRLKELIYILKKNGANRLQVFAFSFYYRFRLFVKHVVMLFGDDFRFKIIKKY